MLRRHKRTRRGRPRPARGLLLCLLWLLGAGCGPQRTEGLPLFLQVEAAGPAGPPPPLSGAGVSLAWASVPAGWRGELAEDFVSLTERLRLRGNPLWVDLSDESDERAARDALTIFLPSFNAASTLVLGAWRTAGVDASALRIRAVPAGAPGAGAGAPVSAAVLGRARLAAWPLLHGLLVEAPRAEVAAQAAEVLRRQIFAPRTALALVLHGGAAPVDDGLEERIRRSAARLLALGVDSAPLSAELLAAVAELQARARAPAWLGLSDQAVLVVPRLARVADPGALSGEVSRLLDQAGLRARVRLVAALDPSHVRGDARLPSP